MGEQLRNKAIGILTSGGDCPALNAAIRGVGKAAMDHYGMEVFGILDGFRGLVENRTRLLVDGDLSGILTKGGTFLGTSRDKPHRMPVAGGGEVDLTAVAIANYRRLHLDCLVTLGGGGTLKNAARLVKHGGINVVALPKTIDNDVWGTDVCFGYDTALTIVAEAIDRLHSTADSHHRIMVVETMGHNTGWLALGAGVAGGADVILIPEVPYDLDVVSESLVARLRRGRRFSIVVVAEGAFPKGGSAPHDHGTEEGSSPPQEKKKKKKAADDPEELAPTDDDAAVLAAIAAAAGQEVRPPKKSGKKKKKEARYDAPAVEGGGYTGVGAILAAELQRRTHLEARVTVLGHLQRGGTPTPTDRVLATRLGTAAADLIARGQYNVMVAVRGTECVPVPLEEVAGKLRTVPLDHPLIDTARKVGTCLGDVL
ncbi:MAG: ATP-dependent 6-phosphofructokinase [Armatimonadota bacterium]|nr:ATP-dependent 6-phosphofructokinase [Armatimonadota bacterium]